ncbi:MAG: NUDIX hydrolase [Nitrospirota bacterium]
MKPATIKHLRSAGGVVFRRTGTAVEVALIATRDRTVWTLPKGIIDKGEKAEVTALREIGEETGLTGRIVGSLGDKSYWFYQKNENVKYRKTVTFFLVEYVGGELAGASAEVDEARWVPLEAAVSEVAYKSDREILEKAKELLAAHG